MEILNTPHKKKSAVLTVIFAVLFLLLFFVLGLTYYDPPISYGMEVNFGTLAQGSGSVQPKKPTAAKPSVVQEKQVEEKQQVTPEEIIPDKKTPEKPVETPPEKVVPQVSEATKSVVSNLLKNKTQEGEQSAGEGDDAVQGDKGKLDGNPYATSYYSTAGLGGRGKGFGLNGRNLQSNGKVVQECNQEGTVVVRITVNNQGNVIMLQHNKLVLWSFNLN